VCASHCCSNGNLGEHRAKTAKRHLRLGLTAPAAPLPARSAASTAAAPSPAYLDGGDGVKSASGLRQPLLAQASSSPEQRQRRERSPAADSDEGGAPDACGAVSVSPQSAGEASDSDEGEPGGAGGEAAAAEGGAAGGEGEGGGMPDGGGGEGGGGAGGGDGGGGEGGSSSESTAVTKRGKGAGGRRGGGGGGGSAVASGGSGAFSGGGPDASAAGGAGLEAGQRGTALTCAGSAGQPAAGQPAAVRALLGEKLLLRQSSGSVQGVRLGGAAKARGRLISADLG